MGRQYLKISGQVPHRRYNSRCHALGERGLLAQHILISDKDSIQNKVSAERHAFSQFV